MSELCQLLTMSNTSLQIDTSGRESTSAPGESPSERTPINAAHSPRPCVFFAQGVCKHGDACRFSHDPQLKVRRRIFVCFMTISRTGQDIFSRNNLDPSYYKRMFKFPTHRI
ncbi:zinc finger CCCH domain-containing protein [archaeon]|nr:MAG: zinc finger CCCH domain-containing protein [archaeon]